MEVIEEDAKEFVAGEIRERTTMGKGILEERNAIDDPSTVDREIFVGTNEKEIVPSCCKSEKRVTLR